MKFNHILKYTSLLLVGLLAGNAFAFVVGMGPAMEKLSATSYIGFHQSMQRSFLAWTPLLCAMVVLLLAGLLIEMRHKWKRIEFLFVVFALVCVMDELFMTWTGNMPLNRIIHSWQIQGTPNDWEDIRRQWVQLMYWRCALLVSGFALLIASVLVKRTEAPISQDVAVAF
ncbi:MAG: DUF1772 domain-containing protein [Bdellovibrio sp.]|nr:DUF1772 domain-containing protein [Bdellovibrio sp.]